MTMDSSSRYRPTFERRELLRLAARAASAAAACGGACAVTAMLAGCTVPVRSFAARGGSTVAVPIDRYPELERPGGIVKVLLPGSGAVFVRHEGEGRYTGISAVCTHQGGIVDPAGSGFRCPNHGSTFDAEGNRTGGPARQPLRRFRAVREGGSVVLSLAS